MRLSLSNKHHLGAAPATASDQPTNGCGAQSSQGTYAPVLNTTNKKAEILVDVKYPTSPLDLYNLMFDSDFLSEFLVENQKVRDLEFDDWEERKEDSNLLMRDFHYTRPNSGVGPKEVYCEEHEENQHRDEHDYIETQTTTKTPNVTYGKSFHVLTHTKIAWVDRDDAEKGSVLNVVVEIIWTGWCPFKGMIEGRVIDGQKQYSSDMDAAVRQELELQQQQARNGAPRPRRAISSQTRLPAQTRRSSSHRSQHHEKQKPRFVRFLSTVSTNSSSSSSSGPEDADEKSDVELSWMEKQQSPGPSYMSQSFGSHSGHGPSRTHRFRLAVLVVLVSLALTLIVLRLSA